MVNSFFVFVFCLFVYFLLKKNTHTPFKATNMAWLSFAFTLPEMLRSGPTVSSFILFVVLRLTALQVLCPCLWSRPCHHVVGRMRHCCDTVFELLRAHVSVVQCVFGYGRDVVSNKEQSACVDHLLFDCCFGDYNLRILRISFSISAPWNSEFGVISSGFVRRARYLCFLVYSSTGRANTTRLLFVLFAIVGGMFAIL